MKTFEIHSLDKNGDPDVVTWDVDDGTPQSVVEEFAAHDFWTVVRVIEQGGNS